MLKRLLIDCCGILFLGLVLVAIMLLGTGCDEESIPEVHGTISVSPSPLPPFEVRFREGEEQASPTPVEF